MPGVLTPLVHSEPGQQPQPLLPMKLAPPPTREGVLLRPDLQALLSEVRLHPLTLLIAPTGYGKTTLLAQWVQELNRTGAPVCWLTLDSGERSPGVFLAYLISAFQAVFPWVGADAARVLRSASNLETDWPLVAGALCSDIQQKLPTATFLVLDDLHVASDSAVICQILGYILRAVPPSLHIIISSRRAVSFAPLARLRAENRVLELTQSNLHLSADEVCEILALQDVTLNEPELALLLERTDGWVLSVQLAARALAGVPSEQRSEFVRALGGSQEQLLTYLSTEVFADLSQELIDFLRLAAIPSYFDSALLEEVLLYEGVPYLLQRSLRLGLPIAPVDKSSDRLHFHPLWRELLLRGIAQTIDTETLKTLNMRFGHALEIRGDLEAALDHYARAGATDDLSRALRERAWPLLQSPQRDTVRRWMEQLPAEIRDKDAELLYIWGMSQVATEPDRAVKAIERAVELYRLSNQVERELRALADLAALLFWQVRPDSFVAICMKAVRAANYASDSWARGATRVCVTAMLFMKGRYTAALLTSRQAGGYPLNPSWRWLLAMIVSSIHCQLGLPREAIRVIDEALRLPLVDRDDRLRQHLLRQRAQALYDQGQTAESITLALSAHYHLGDYYRDGITGFSATDLALLLMLQRRVDEATTYLAQARAAFHNMGALHQLAHLQAIELYGLMLRGQATNACAAVNSVLRRLHISTGYTPDLRLWLLLALILGEGGENQRARDLIQETILQMEHHGYRLFLVCAHLYHAYLAGRCGDIPARREALRAGWTMVVADDHRYLPMLPVAVLCDVVAAALREGLALQAAGLVLRRQLSEQAVDLLQGLLADPAPSVRMIAARLLGDVGAAAAYPALRPLLKERDPMVRQAAEDALSRLTYRPPYTLHIRTLGTFGLWRGEQEVKERDWRSSKARHLFQLLLTERGRTLSRDRILETLWPEMETDAAANNLRVTLNRLSKAIEPDRPDGAPPSYILQQNDAYTFNLNSDYQLDVTDFIAAVSEGQQCERQGQRHPAIMAYRRAMNLYSGPFLPDAMYEDWTVVERERLILLFDDAATRLGILLLDEGMAHEAIGLAWRVLENDQSHEEAYRLLMRAHAHLGERSTALRLYTRCVNVLRDELGVEPMPETTALYNKLREMR